MQIRRFVPRLVNAPHLAEGLFGLAIFVQQAFIVKAARPISKMLAVALRIAPDTFLRASIQTARYVVESGMIGTITSAHCALSRDVSLFAEHVEI